MNIYDFDDTIYDGNTCRDIVFYGIKKHPIITLKALLKANKLDKDYKKGLIPFERVKEAMLSFIFQIDNYPAFIKSFVSSHIKKIKPWYMSRKKDNDVIVTASYELWISEFAKLIGIRYVIGTKVDKDGRIIGKNCKGEEKVNRIKEIYPNGIINCSYSDSSADIPILELANVAYVVEGNNLIPYKSGYKFKNNN